MNRLFQEKEFHDRQASLRARDFALHPEKFCFSDQEYLSHESWIMPSIRQLGKLAGKQILDFGCGHGMAAVVLARQGAKVTAMDLSPGYLTEAKKRAEANKVALDLVQGNGEFLPFADNSFDAVWGNAILHHLDVQKAGEEIHRVLLSGGTAVFCEPWGENPALNWVRNHLPYAEKDRTPDEQPLQQKQIQCLREIFSLVQLQPFQLISMARAFLPGKKMKCQLQRWDDYLFRAFPSLSRFCRYMVITLKK